MKRNLLTAVACAAVASMAVSSMCFAAGTFKVGFDAEFPPYSFMNEDGEYTGFDVDLAKAVAELEGWEFIPAPLVWDSRDDVMASGEIDCIWSAYAIAGREDSYAWTAPYMNSGTVVLTKENSGIASLADLAGKVVGVQSGSSSLDLISEGGAQAELGATFDRIWQFANTTNEFMALINGNVDAIVEDAGVARYYVGATEGYTILPEALKEDGLCGVAFATDNTEMRDTVDEALATLAENGTLAAIAEKYSATDIVVLDGAAAAPAEAESEPMAAETELTAAETMTE